MPRPRNVTQVLVAASAVVVAVSIAFLTVRFMISGLPVYVQHETTRDTSYFAPQVMVLDVETGEIEVGELFALPG